MRLIPILCLATALMRAQTADTPPTLIYRGEPEYSAEATRARVQSEVTLSITIGEDGQAHNIQVSEGAGFGLDEKAMEAMQKWRFNPAMHDGKPVASPANIEMNFSMLVRNDTENRTGQRARLNFTLPPEATRPELIIGKLPGDPALPGDQSLRFHLIVDTQGVPKNVTTVESNDPAWEKIVQRVVQTWRFKPASLNGQNVSVEGIFEMQHSGPLEPPEETTTEVRTITPDDSVSEPDTSGPRAAPPPALIAGLTARTHHTATLLGNGTVLIAGGASLDATPHNLASAQTFDPITRGIANTGTLLTARQNHTASLLRDGTVLIAGGESNGHAIATTEFFNPSTGTFSKGPDLRTARHSHQAIGLADGRILICGGIGADGKPLASAEIYDPRTKSFIATGSMSQPRANFSAAPLNDGKILVTGNNGASALIVSHMQIAGDKDPVTAEVFDPTTNSFFATTKWASFTRDADVLLANGKVLIAVGPQTEILNPATGAYTAGPVIAHPHAGDTATLLDDGNVLVAGADAELLLVR
jgi:TonB family protein